MAFRNALQIINAATKFKCPSELLQPHPQASVITTTRSASQRPKIACTKCKKVVAKQAKAPSKTCPDTSCNKKPPKKSFWSRIFGADEEPLPPKHTCKLKQARAMLEDPDLSHIEGKPYRTCGEAFIVQRDRVPEKSDGLSKEDEILKRIEADLHVKHMMKDPMPPFISVEQRLLDLSERRLHPLYRLQNTIPKASVRKVDSKPPRFVYKTRSGPVGSNEIPKRLRFNKELMEKKNLFADFKRVEPPQQMVAKMVELESNLDRSMVKNRRRRTRRRRRGKKQKRQEES